MNSFQRLKKILAGCLMFLCGVFFLLYPDNAYIMLAVILAIALAIKGIRDIYFYFSIARYMVGGKMILFQGVIMLDFAMLSGALTNLPQPMVMVYLIVVHLFSGVVEVLRAMEAKKTVNGSWKLKFCHGIINLLLGLVCFATIWHPSIPIIVFSLGLMYSGVMQVIEAFQKTTFVLIK